MEQSHADPYPHAAGVLRRCGELYRQMRGEIEEAKKEKSRAYHREYSRAYRARNLEKQREYDRMKAREYRARKKAQAAA